MLTPRSAPYASEQWGRWALADERSDRLVNNAAANCTNTVVMIYSVGKFILISLIACSTLSFKLTTTQAPHR